LSGKKGGESSSIQQRREKAVKAAKGRKKEKKTCPSKAGKGGALAILHTNKRNGIGACPEREANFKKKKARGKCLSRIPEKGPRLTAIF